ncbi:hypothetical protein QTP88_012715 [Uroleucon formosanum]
MRVSNWFIGSRISFVCALRFIYCWAGEMSSSKWCQTQLGICRETTECFLVEVKNWSTSTLIQAIKDNINQVAITDKYPKLSLIQMTGASFHTFSSPVSRPYRVAIRGLHTSTLITDISTTLEELGHQWLSKNPTKRATAFLSVIDVNLLAIFKTIVTTPPAELNVVQNTLYTSAPRTGKVAKCALFSGDHTANFRGCPAFKNAQKK